MEKIHQNHSFDDRSGKMNTSEPRNGFTVKYNMKASDEHQVEARKS